MREQMPKAEATVSNKPISEVPYYHFCPVLLVLEIDSGKVVKWEETMQNFENQERATLGPSRRLPIIGIMSLI